MPRQHIYPEQWGLTNKARSLDLSHPHGKGFDPACLYCVRGKGVSVKAYYAAMPDGVLVNEWHTLMGARRREHNRNGAFQDLCLVIPLMEERGLLVKTAWGGGLASAPSLLSGALRSSR